ncbi:MAG: IS5 family transposase [Cytophagaceae bacterium]|nr:MAG: IS5 family transposase [Cytophagaceae bacterium]
MRRLVSDELWAIVEPLLPPPKPRHFRYAGRHPVDNRVALTAIVFVLKTGIAWEDVPHELGCCGMTAWNKLHEWQELGLWEHIHVAILEKLQKADKLDWERAAVDSSSVRATQGGGETGPNPTDRAKPGTKHHALSDGNGLPLATSVTAANRNDITQLRPLVEAIPVVKGKRGRPRKRPKKLLADRAYDSEPHRKWLKAQGIIPKLAKRRIPHGSGLGKERWPIERLMAWFNDDRQLRIRDERLPTIHQAFLTLASALICFNAL